ncbi:MAG: lactate racemase domain-containing protein, partial [Anaerolineae bacterium]|nr:lactate racemase domain-containing protein [Anaerolineae bacterium]
MTEFRLPYGKTHVTFTLPDEREIAWIAPLETPAAPDPAALVLDALNAQVGGTRLSDFADAKSVAIAISDKTRPIPHAMIVALLDRLRALGLPEDAITFLIATGTHAPMLPD